MVVMPVRNRLVLFLEFFVLLDEILSLTLNFSHHFFERGFPLLLAFLSYFGAYLCISPCGSLLDRFLLVSYSLFFFDAATDKSISGEAFDIGDWPFVKIG